MNKPQPLLVIRILSILAFILMLTVNALANILPINGQNTGQVSNLYPNLFTPAALTFSIWGVIYLFLLLYTIYQTGLLGKKSQNFQKAIRETGGLYILTCLANTAWILCWHYNLMALSVGVMLILLVTLIIIYLKLRKSIGAGKTLGEKWMISVPFSLYLAWISVATIANITALLVKIKWDAFGIAPQIFTIAVIIVAITLTWLVQRRYRDIAYSLVVIWALTGILIQHMGFFKMTYWGIIITVVMGMAILLIGCYTSAFKKKKTEKKTSKKRKRRH